MKKSVPFFIGLFLWINVSFSQSSVNPFKLDNTEWFEVQAFYPPSGGTLFIWSYNFYKLCGDTLFDGKLYKRIDSGSVKYYPYPPPPFIGGPTSPSHFSFCCFFRQDSLTKSNYLRMPLDTSDNLLCSYDLNVGDTLKTGFYASTFYNNSGGGSTIPIIVKKDSIIYAGKKLNIFYTDTVGYMTTQFCHKTSKGMFLIEGLGHSYGLMNPFMEPFEGANRLDSISFTASCSNNPLAIKAINGNGLSISPNPNNGSFFVDANEGEKQTLQIFDVNGKIVFTQIIKGNTKVDVSNLPNGLYNISISANEGVVNKRIVISK
jgi:hypothetical protein